MAEIIPVGMAETKTAQSPCLLAAYGIGSCLVVTLYDQKSKIGGMAHIMLPESRNMSQEGINVRKFADTSVKDLYLQMLMLGCDRYGLVAKMFGGSQMFPPVEGVVSIGKKNVAVALKELDKLKICVAASDTGGSKGRSIIFDLDNGIVNLSVLGEKTREL